MATCNKCQQYRGLKSKRGRQLDGQIEVEEWMEKKPFCLVSFFSFTFCVTTAPSKILSLLFPAVPHCFPFSFISFPFLSSFFNPFASCLSCTVAPAGALVRHHDWFVIYGVHKWARLIGLFKGSTQRRHFI